MLRWQDYEQWLGPVLKQTSFPDLPAPVVGQWQTDSRQLQAGQWFIPLRGERFDGHTFIAQALQTGATGFLYDASYAHQLNAAQKAVGIAVTDTLQAFQAISKGWRQSLKQLKLLALTGSSGKTTTREMMFCVLQAAGSTLKIQQNYNNEIGVPITLCQLLPEHQYACLEFGARHVGNIAFLVTMATPNVCTVLNIGSAHVGEFGSPEKLRQTKLEMFRTSAPHATLVGNADDPHILSAMQSSERRWISFGRSSHASVQLLTEKWLPNGTMELTFRVHQEHVTVRLPLAHAAYPINAAAVLAMSYAANIPLAKAVEGLAQFNGVKGRFMRLTAGPLQLIDDSYNANPESMMMGIDSLRQAFPNEPIVMVLGDMLELGESAPTAHQQIGAYAAQKLNIGHLFAVGPHAKQYVDGARASGLSAGATSDYAQVDDLIAQLGKLEKSGKVIYFKGSNGIKLSRAIQALVAKYET